MAERDGKRWGIEKALARDIGIVFETTSALVSVLGITPPTWKRITEGKGVKRNTAMKVVKEYFLLLRSFEEQGDVPEGTYELYGLDMLEKYRDHIQNHRFEDFVSPAPEIRKSN